MGNVYAALPVPAGDGTGAWVDVSSMGKIKTITVDGAFEGTLTIEFSHDAGTGQASIVSFTQPGKKTIEIAAQVMRTRFSGYLSGTPTVDVAANDNGARFVNLPVPAGDGVGAAVDVSTLGTFNTIICAGTFTGSVIIGSSDRGWIV